MSVKRMGKTVTVERPVVVGTVAYWLGKRADDQKTHKWTAYIRGPSNEDLTYFIKRVVFKLHESFKNPKRVVEQPPFEIHEEGWGEFEIAVMIYFTDPAEKHVELIHMLKLHPPEGHVAKTKKPVVSETFDVIVFNDPTESFYKKLIDNEQSYSNAPAVPTQIGDQYANFTEQAELTRMAAARTRVQAEINTLQTRYLSADDEVIRLSHEIHVLQQALSKNSSSSSSSSSAPSSSSSSSSSSHLKAIPATNANSLAHTS